MVVYQLVLILSALFASAAIGMVLRYACRVLGVPAQHAQLGMVIAALGFLIVVALPAPVVIAALLLVLGALIAPRTDFWVWAMRVPAAVLVALGIAQSAGGWPSGDGYLLLAAAAGGFAIALCGLMGCASLALPRLQSVVALAALPLLAAPLVMPQVHTSLALDAALLLAALLGGRVHGAHTASLPVRLLVAAIMAYLPMQAAHYGAWPLALVSVALLLGGFVTMGRRHA